MLDLASVTARAPSNIALIKYMGKSDTERNIPANGSISMTLDKMCTVAQVLYKNASGDPKSEWKPEPPAYSEGDLGELTVPILSGTGRVKIERHIERIRFRLPEILEDSGIEFRGDRDLICRTANTFPSGAGIASSASSFAAVTLAAAAAMTSDPNRFATLVERDENLRMELSAVSREGSGSSCRSFVGPWSIWESGRGEPLHHALPEMSDLILLISKAPKRVSSSEAHERVLDSPLWEGRVERVDSRMNALQSAVARGDLATVSRIAWSESWEMHSLFHTCPEPFSYWEPETIRVLRWFASELDRRWKNPKLGSPPVVTLDAGPNVHVLVPQSDGDFWRNQLQKNFPSVQILSDVQGSPARVLRAEGSS